jgi:hypothetical protein
VDRVVPIFATAFLFGSILSLRFRFPILIVAAAGASVLIVAIGLPQPQALSTILLSIAAGVCGLQVGYAAGVLAGAAESFGRPIAGSTSPHASSSGLSVRRSFALLRFGEPPKNV